MEIGRAMVCVAECGGCVWFVLALLRGRDGPGNNATRSQLEAARAELVIDEPLAQLDTRGLAREL
jgi:hypothetical protein